MDINPNPRTPDFNVGSYPWAMPVVAKFFSFQKPSPVIFSTLRSGDGGGQPVHQLISDDLVCLLLLAKNSPSTVL